ncbi:hypothetical protein ACIB24_19850 [Spongisporangium articulatum]|uniref:Uncharacterized protein n=1 Tax=Spongisporangium articulatum TaxID=3362603 RepID=A0ABW8AUN1_9ACTN
MSSAAAAPGSGRARAAEQVDRVNRWALRRLPDLNREILAGTRPGSTFPAELAHAVLPDLPDPRELTVARCEQLVVSLGLAGASVARHYQEADEAHRATPAAAFDGLVTADGRSFRQYFGEIADRTGTGHAHRDTFSSLVRWNLPPCDVEVAGATLVSVRSRFADGRARTYTGAPDEVRFLGLLKASEAVEQAANTLLNPISDGTLHPDDPYAANSVARAVVLIDLLRSINQDFIARPPEDGLRTGFFLDVFRQFAVHWEVGDVPPSGAQDVEFLIRDLLLGIDLAEYPRMLRAVFPSLLAGERLALYELFERPSLPELVLDHLDLDGGQQLEAATPAELRALVHEHPVLAALYLLLNAHARIAGVHLRMSKRFLFDPQRDRDQSGYGDPGVVSNRVGTTGMDEQRLELLTHARHHHPLRALRAVPARELEEIAGLPRLRDQHVEVRFRGTTLSPEELGLPAPGLPQLRPPAHLHEHATGRH